MYNNIKKYRELKGYTQKELAEFLNVNRSYVSYLENSKKNVNPRTIKKIADFLNVPESWLYLQDYNLKELDNSTKKLIRDLITLTENDAIQWEIVKKNIPEAVKIDTSEFPYNTVISCSLNGLIFYISCTDINDIDNVITLYCKFGRIVFKFADTSQSKELKNLFYISVSQFSPDLKIEIVNQVDNYVNSLNLNSDTDNNNIE